MCLIDTNLGSSMSQEKIYGKYATVDLVWFLKSQKNSE